MSAAVVSPLSERAATAPAGAKDLALSFFAALSRGDAPGALALLAADAAVDIVPVAGAAPDAGRRFFEALLTAFPDLQMRVLSAMEAGEVAVIETKMEGTQAADFLGVLNQEKHVDVDQAWMVWAAHGRIAGLRAYFCQNQLYRRLAVKRLDRVWILG